MEKGGDFFEEEYTGYFLKGSQEKIIKVKADVVFGAANKNCNGLGICQVMAKGSLPHKKIRCRFASAEIHVQNRNLKMVFKARDLCGRLKSDLFNSPLFVLEDGFMISGKVASKLMINNRTIEAGIYPLYFYDDRFVIVFS